MASTTETRCPHCLMPVGVADGVAIDHDFPYAVAAYGHCEGSGRPTLAGPATPPVVWGDDFGAFAGIGVLPSPLPTVTRRGWTVTITGVRFTHSTHCSKCRKVVYVATEGGVIEIGFDSKGRSFEDMRAGGRALYDGPCPNGCGARVAFSGHPRNESRALPVADGYTVQFREWEQLRRDLGVYTLHMTPADLTRLCSRNTP